MAAAATAVRQRPARPMQEGSAAFDVQEVRPSADLARRRVAYPVRDLAAKQADRQAITYVLSFVMLAWFVAIAIGCYYYDGIRPQRNRLPGSSVTVLEVFDRLFRAVGALLPFSVVGFRVLSHYLLQGRAVPEGSEQRSIVLVYVGMTMIRAAVYNLLLLAGSRRSKGSVAGVGPHDTMSDHVFLASCILAQLLSEVAILVRLLRGSRTKPAMRGAAWLALGMAGFWVALTVGEVYVTSLHYHPGHEVAKAVLAGCVIFQAPVLYFAAVLLPNNPYF